MRYKNYLFIPIIFFSLFAEQVNAQLVVNSNAPYNNISYLVNNILLGSGVVASNITYSGAPLAIGYFNGQNSNLNLDSGIILTSGDIITAVGPNNSPAGTIANNTPGDLQLEQLTNNTVNGSFDAAILEFDFTAKSDTIKFEYVFGSEEYLEWVGSSFNDAFAFIISGVSVPMPAKNIALIPSPPAPLNTPVTIDNVNDVSYPQYYFDNETPAGTSVQYDGFTTVLTAITPVLCGQTYHIKLVVADIGDQSYDSGVFLKAGSFSSNAFNVSANVSYGSLNDSTLYEGCGQACIIVNRGSSNLINPDTVILNLSGTVLNGVDITLLPDTVFFAAGQDSIQICITGLSDAMSEGPETLTMLAVLLATTACSPSDSATITLYIDDHLPLVVASSGDTSICPGNSSIIAAGISLGVQPYIISWAPSAGLSCTTCANPSASPSVTTTYTVNVTDSCSNPIQVDSVKVIILPAPVITVSGNSTLCSGQSATINASGGNTYLWNTGATTTSIIVSPTTSTSYTVSGSNGICNTIGTFSVNVTTTPFINASANTSICSGATILVSAVSSTGNYSWSTGAVTSFINVSPVNTTTYYVSDSNVCGSVMDSVTVTVYTTPTVTITGNSPLCLGVGQSVTLNASGGNTYSWSTGATTSSITVAPAINTTYAVTGYVSPCSTSTAFFLNVIITPTITVSADNTICPGTSTNLSASSATGTFNWSTGAVSSFITVAPLVTTTYSVHSSNVCGSDTDVVVITVLAPGPVVLNSPDVTLCKDGKSLTLSTTVTGGATPYNYQWSTVSGNDPLSSTTSPNPSLIPTGIDVYQATVTDQCGNTTAETISILVEDCQTIVPNVISADGNGVNDHFVIRNLDHYPGSRLVVFDRWGIRLLDDPNYQNNWDAHGYTDGTYYYVLYRADGEIFPGFVTVVRQ